MTITDFNGTTGDTRTFYSAYFVLDISNPEKDPVLLWSFTDASLGLTTSRPEVLRVSASGDVTDNAGARWMMVVGSGVTTYNGTSTQTGKIFVIDLATGQLVGAPFSTDANASMGDVTTADTNLDYRADVIYVGDSIDNSSGSPKFIGKVWRLTTEVGGCAMAPCNTTAWGISSGPGRAPTTLLAKFPSDGSIFVGPVIAAPAVSFDERDAMWVYWGTGRFYSNADKTNTDRQHFFGVKDAVMTGGCTQSNATNCEANRLVNMSDAVVCTECTPTTKQVTGVPVAGIEDFDQLRNLFGNPAQNVDGWYIILPGVPGSPPVLGERSLSHPAILGGIIFFSTFTPSQGDICNSSGDGRIYALFYTTGSAFKTASLGTDTLTGNKNAKRFLDIGVGLPSQVGLQIGRQGTGAEGTTGAQGCSSQVTSYVPVSGATPTICVKPALRVWSAVVAWRDM